MMTNAAMTAKMARVSHVVALAYVIVLIMRKVSKYLRW